MKLAIISSHPIQYNAPLFTLLSKESKIDLMVFYTWGVDSVNEKYDPDFGQNIKWDIPLLDGYNYQFQKNTSTDPGSHHFKGIINPELNLNIEEWGADVVWVWGWAYHSHLRAIRYFNGKKEIWFRGDSTLLDESKGISIMKMLRRTFLKWVYGHIDKAFFVGTHNKAYFKKHGLKETQLVYAPHAIDSNHFDDSNGTYTNEAKKWRSMLNIDTKQKVLLFCGKLEKKKNPFFMLDLINRLPKNQYKVLFVGAGSLANELQEKAPNNCIFLGFQNQSKMPIIYRMADFFVLPSIGPGETWGLAINEALTCSIPVIASEKCGGAIDLINPANGLIMKNNNSIPTITKWLFDFKINESLFSQSVKSHSYHSIIDSILDNLP